MLRMLKDWMTGRTVLSSFEQFYENQAARNRGCERDRSVLKGGAEHLGGSRVTLGGVRGFSLSLYKVTLCVGIVGRSGPVSWPGRVYSLGEEGTHPASPRLSSSTTELKV